MFIGAFIGAMAVMLIILAAATRVKSIITLLIVGLMAGYVCGAVISILTAFVDRQRIASFAMWNMGSFAGFTWLHVKVMYAIVGPMLLCSFLMAKPLNALQMGDRYAKSMGINVKATRYALVFLSSVLTAAVTAFAGPVSFIGLAVPHICRIVFRTADSRVLIPGAILGGAFMASLCDFIARNILSPMELPLGAVTAVIGAPVVIFLLTRKEKP
jgi:iron complex transport system permease protein